jgi:hypothetical protein
VSVRLLLVEVKYTDDLKTLEKHAEALNIYSGPQKLTGLLENAGWKIEHNFPTVVVGHRAVVSLSNKQNYAKMGITGKKEQSALQEELGISAARWARDINTITRQKRASHAYSQSAT